MELKKSKRRIDWLVVHCSATKEGANFKAKDINQWHKQKGWSQIGYNYVIDLDGTVEVGRDVDIVPAQVAGYNSHAIGICYVGGVDHQNKPKDTRTVQQKESLLKLLKNLKTLYPKAKIQGHRDFPKVAKACPSFDAKKEYASL